MTTLLGAEADQYGKIDRATKIIERADVCWQASLAMAIHIYAIHVHADPLTEESDRVILENAITPLRQPLESLVNSVSQGLKKAAYDEDVSRALFHSRLALGGLYLVKGDHDRALEMLTTVLETSYTEKVRRVNNGGDIYDEIEYVHEFPRVPPRLDVLAGKHFAGVEKPTGKQAS